MLRVNEISTGLTLGQDGIWYSAIQDSISYPTDGNQNCLAVEESSFWFEHRNKCIASLVGRFPPVGGGTILDIGGGNGFVSRGLIECGFDAALVEPGPAGAKNAKSRGISTVICATTKSAKFHPNSISAVGLFDVVEHIEDENEFLRSIHKILKHEGRVYLTVPSYQFLWSLDDQEAGHFRRYSISQIRTVLESVGFQIEYSTYIFRILSIAILFFRTLPFRLGFKRSARSKPREKERADHSPRQGLIGRAVTHFLGNEVSNLERGLKMHFGGSCLVVARKIDIAKT